MPEIILEISLNRSSGVLAGIVASLAQADIELKSQKLQRATEGRGGWLTIVGSGESPEPAELAERLDGNRGVEKVMRVIVDGEAVLAEGKPLDDQIQTDDLAELPAGSDSVSDGSPDEYEPTEFDAEPNAESDLADTLSGGEEIAETDEASAADGEDREDSDPAQVGAVLRRRRRRRR